MKLYGFIKNKYFRDGFVMPIFKDDNGQYFFQRICKNNSIKCITLDLENDKYDELTEYEMTVSIDLNERAIAFLDGEKLYVGSKEYIFNMAKQFDLYKKYEMQFKELGKEVYKESLKKLEKLERNTIQHKPDISNRRVIVLKTRDMNTPNKVFAIVVHNQHPSRLRIKNNNMSFKNDARNDFERAMHASVNCKHNKKNEGVVASLRRPNTSRTQKTRTSSSIKGLIIKS